MKYNKIVFSSYSSVDYKKFHFKKKLSIANFKNIVFNKEYKAIPKFILTPELNIFKQIKIIELKHSRILANLLDPSGTHGYNDMFLKLFLEVFCPELTDIGKEHWNVTEGKEFYDIRIRNIDNSKIIIIENKSGEADDQPNQLYRYWFNGIYLAQLNRKLSGLDCYSKMIYLSPADYKQPEEQSITRPEDLDKAYDEKVPDGLIEIKFFYDHIVKWLNKCLSIIDKNTNVYYYIEQYRNYWRIL